MTEGRPVILVVYDEPHITHVVALKLRHAGYDVVTAGDGEEGFEIACETDPTLIITDLQMPYMTGLEMCRKLADVPATARTPVLVLTARGYHLSPDDTAGSNIKGMISKPFSPREILDKVATLIGEAGPRTAEAA
jgi:two-component system phosphate regulon response regulator PhoB